MVLKMYSIRDQKAGVYNTPFFQRTHGEAERTFRDLINDPKSMVYKYPEDYDLYYHGEYDDIAGMISALDTPQHIVKAIQFVEPKMGPEKA